MPGLICFSWVSRKLPTAHHVRVSMSVNISAPLCAYMPSEMVRLVTTASNGEYTLQLSRSYCAVWLVAVSGCSTSIRPLHSKKMSQSANVNATVRQGYITIGG